MNDWKEYTNSDEQIAEMQDCKYGFILLYKDKKQYEILTAQGDFFGNITRLHPDVTHYWIIPADPLREMKLRHDATGQPVWIRLSESTYWAIAMNNFDVVTNENNKVVIKMLCPKWDIPNAEYSFTPFED